ADLGVGGTAAAAIEPNPLDLTGPIMASREAFDRVVARYLKNDVVDALLLIWPLDDASPDFRPIARWFAQHAAATAKPLILVSVEDSRSGAWARELERDNLALSRGLRATVRALDSMGAYVRHNSVPQLESMHSTAAIAPPPQLLRSSAGPLLSFSDAMSVLRSAGIPVAPFEVVGASVAAAGWLPQFPGPYVVKLANVPHRTDIGAVHICVHDVGRAVEELRVVAHAHGLPAEVVVQPRLQAEGEAFIGVQSDTDFGPLVVAGIGGIMVEVIADTTARIAPFDHGEARRMLEKLNPRVTRGARGKRAWDLEQLATIVCACAGLACSSREWLQSLDINPLVFGPDGFVAVDALIVAKAHS
ncbi:MAG: acetate--CoA ligase family protein, partial [Steroidobacteraceae bacterium]